MVIGRTDLSNKCINQREGEAVQAVLVLLTKWISMRQSINEILITIIVM